LEEKRLNDKLFDVDLGERRRKDQEFHEKEYAKDVLLDSVKR